MSSRRVVVTGLGLVTPLGVGVEALWNGLMEGRCGVRAVERWDPGDMPATYYGELPEFDYGDYIDEQQAAHWGDASKLAVMGGVLAARDAGVENGFVAERTGVILGTGYGGNTEFEGLYDTYYHRGWRKLKPATVPRTMNNAPASHLGIRFGARGVNFTVSTACSSGAIAAGVATQQIRAGVIDACISGGVDTVVNRSISGAWNRLRVLSKIADESASRPFSADRAGLVLAEGCGILILEEREAALARGARIYAEIAGVGATNDATNIVGPDVLGEIEATQIALADAGVEPGDIGYINAHGTSTKANDANESKVIKEVFGERAYEVPVSSIKGHIGHPMGAAGGIEVGVTALALYHQRVPPTLHYTPGDEVCDLDYVADGARDVEMDYALTNSFGFGGQNSVVVLKRA